MDKIQKVSINLYINFYEDKNKERDNELTTGFLKNVNNDLIDTIHIFSCNSNDLNKLLLLRGKLSFRLQQKLIIHLHKDNRPTFNEFFKLTQNSVNDNNISIIAHSDIIFDENSLEKIKSFDFGNKCMALTRYDYKDDEINNSEAIFFDRKDSQDVWIKKGHFEEIEGADFGLGICGCDNRIAYLLAEKYNVINPSLDIKTYHYHITGVRNYVDKFGQIAERITPPYKILPPEKLKT